MLHSLNAMPSELESRTDRLVVRVCRSDSAKCTVAVEGELDLATAPKLRSRLVEALGAGFRELTLDLSRVDHMDSTGLAVLIGLRERLKGEGRLVVAGAPPSVLRVLDLTGLASKFELAPQVASSADEPVDAAGAGARIGLTADAELVLGLLATALPFAESRAAEAERWLRVLRSHGDTARVLREIGVSEAPTRDPGGPEPSQSPEGRRQENQDPTQHVIEQATALARERGANLIGTLELLAAVMQAYGADFDEVLHSHGTNRAVLIRHINREASPSM
jgi:anti-sigma B factor antagonist